MFCFCTSWPAGYTRIESLEILQDTGVSVRLPEAVELLAAAGCDIKGDLVKMPRRIVEECLDMAPDRINVYDRLENMAMQLEGRNPHFGTGPTIPCVMDMDSLREIIFNR